MFGIFEVLNVLIEWYGGAPQPTRSIRVVRGPPWAPSSSRARRALIADRANAAGLGALLV